MNHAARRVVYQQIEAERNTKVLALVTGERLGLETQIATDAVVPFVALLDQIGPTKKLSLVLDTLGGHTSAAWRLINLIRSFCDDLEVIVPSKAMSAGTLMTLGADSIVMTKQAALGPIDPSLPNHVLAPTGTTASGQTINVPVSAEAVRGFIDEVKKDVTDPVALASVWNQLATQIHPLILGDIFRLGAQIRTMAKALIVRQVGDDATQDRIIQILCSDSGSHDYTINRRQAADMGLAVEKPSAELYGLLSQITESYAHELKTLEPYSEDAILAGQHQAQVTVTRGLIESTDGGCFGYVTDGVIFDNPRATLKTFEGWRKLP